YSSTPTGSPITKPKKPDTKVIASVSQTPRTSSHIIGSDITQYLYFYVMFLQPGNCRLGFFLCAVHFRQHNAELHATGVVHLRANNVVIHVKATRGFGQQRCVNGLRSEEHTSELQSRENLVCRLLLEKN